MNVVNVNVVVTEWSPKTKIGINLLDSQLTGKTLIYLIYYEYLYMSLIDQIYYDYLYMSLIDLIYYKYLYMSLIDLIYYLNVNFDSWIITKKLHDINQTINNNLLIVHIDILMHFASCIITYKLHNIDKISH